MSENAKGPLFRPSCAPPTSSADAGFDATRDVPPEGAVREIRVHAAYFEGKIDLAQFRARHPEYPVLALDPLVITPVRDRYVVLTKFGSVVFWNCEPGEIESLEREIAELPGALDRNPQLSDDLLVRVPHETDFVTFKEIRLRQLTLDQVKIISRALGQSVALERFENEVQAALARSEPVVQALRAHGELMQTQREILQTIGFALDVRAAVLANLTLFDSPPEAWESEAVAHVDSQLWDYFDLDERLSAINQKVSYLADLNDTLTDLLNNRKSQRLEWIIIALIFLEIVLFVLAELRRFS